MRQALRFQSLTPCLFVAAALPGLLCPGVAPAAIGCGFHPSPEVQLEGVYPGSFPVAVALRKTADKGVIDAAAAATCCGCRNCRRIGSRPRRR